MQIFEVVKLRQRNNIHRYYKTKRRILLMVSAFALILLLAPAHVFPLSQAFAQDANPITFDEALRLALARLGVVSKKRPRGCESPACRCRVLRFPLLTLKASSGGLEEPQSFPRGEHILAWLALLRIGEGNVSFSEGSYSKDDITGPD